MAACYIASGYGCSNRSIGKCIDQQFKTLFKPYIYTGIATTCLLYTSCAGKFKREKKEQTMVNNVYDLVTRTMEQEFSGQVAFRLSLIHI